MDKIDSTYLRARFTYDPASGRLLNKAGAEVGTLGVRGYRQTFVQGKSYYTHRLVWMYVHGVWPSAGLDHVNGVRDDNRIDNLRPATVQQNNQNRRRAQGKTNPLLGVKQRGNRWEARISHNKKTLHLGRFATATEAHEAYLRAKRTLHTHCEL